MQVTYYWKSIQFQIQILQKQQSGHKIIACFESEPERRSWGSEKIAIVPAFVKGKVEGVGWSASRLPLGPVWSKSAWKPLQMSRCSQQGFTKAAGQPSYLPWGSDWLCEREENQSILFTLTLARPSTPSATASLQANWRERVWIGVHEGRWKTNSTRRLKAGFHSLQPDGG